MSSKQLDFFRLLQFRRFRGVWMLIYWLLREIFLAINFLKLEASRNLAIALTSFGF